MNKNELTAPATIHTALYWATEQFKRSAQLNESNSFHLDAELLLAHALEKPRTHLRSWPETALPATMQQLYSRLVQQRAHGMPIAYLLGQRDFWDLSLRVTADTLIPRPETELLVENALELIPANKAWKIADLGTGSGAIALALAKHRPECHLLAVDNSDAALEVAKSNAKRCDISNLSFLKSHWFAQISPQQFQLIVSNPPYVAENDSHLSRSDVAFEPRHALASGPDGLDDLRHIIVQSQSYLAPGAYLLLEHGFDQANSVAAVFDKTGWENIACLQDLSGQDRVTRAQKPD